ncbi:hypothetical protein CJ030_MR6G029279 [Morella rubra]|uniref:Uncharacterized protein n=1 Tax=Morella rubra TaxID=262757 RepID=A0A6A1VAL8_9ROSI|nr:hypothetical protein CJ030_MR6G029279 [Morella rubra]
MSHGPLQEETGEPYAILGESKPVIVEEEADVGELEPVIVEEKVDVRAPKNVIAEEYFDPNYVLGERSQQPEWSDLYGDAENLNDTKAEENDYILNVDWLGAFLRTEEDNDDEMPSEYEDDDDMQTQKGSDCDEALQSKNSRSSMKKMM